MEGEWSDMVTLMEVALSYHRSGHFNGGKNGHVT